MSLATTRRRRSCPRRSRQASPAACHRFGLGDGDGSARAMFAAELRRLRRQVAGLTQRQLGVAAFVSRELVTKVEAGRRWPDRRFAEAADDILGCGTALFALWVLGDAERIAAHRRAATAAQIERLRMSVLVSGDQQLRQVLHRAALDPSEVSVEVVAAAVAALGELLAGQTGDADAVRRLAELEQRVAGHENRGVRQDALVRLSRLALDLADAVRFLDQCQDPNLRSRVVILVGRLQRLLADAASSLGLVDIVAVWAAVPPQAPDPADEPAATAVPPDATETTAATTMRRGRATTVVAYTAHSNGTSSGRPRPAAQRCVRPGPRGTTGPSAPTTGRGRGRRRRPATPGAWLPLPRGPSRQTSSTG
ncbi:helix-turn-helix transcriptional regulator [Dactylosporangium sp. NPDC051485]|uniref:helix-turn-helix domain-containing protein n=1 Tax=Dactylosporangium sp. NPDC051485 TaxID=3154846 RepID=UPI0034460722